MKSALLVNDDPSQLRMLNLLLEKQGIVVEACHSVPEAIPFLDMVPRLDLIVTDLHMPEIDGWRFCALLRSPEYAAYNQTPILVVSATFSGQDASQVTMDLGANAFLAMPVEARRFEETVQSLLSGGTPRHRPTVLIVEDHPALSDIIEEVFEAHGYQVASALTGAEGKRLYFEHLPELTILDHHLPDSSGESLLEEIKAHNAHAVVLMITADPNPALAVRWMQKGASAYVHKPFQAGYLVELAARACRERALLRVEDLLEARTQELRENIEKFRAFVENAGDIVFEAGADGRFTYVNPFVKTVTGYAPEEVLGHHFLDFIRPDARSQVRATFDRQLASRQPRVYHEFPALRKDRSTVWLGQSVLLEFDDRGAPRYQAICRDITAAKSAEGELRKREAFLSALREAAQVLLDASDTPFQAYLDILGPASTASRVVIFLSEPRNEHGKGYARRAAEWCARGVAPVLGASGAQRYDLDAELVHWHEVLSDGEELCGAAHDFPERERAYMASLDIRCLLALPIMVDGSIAGVLEFDNCVDDRSWGPVEKDFLRMGALDLAAALRRSRSAEELRQSRKRYKHLVDNMQDIVYSLDTGGIVTFASRQMNRYGWDLDHVMGKHFLDFVAPEDRGHVAEIVARAYRLNETWPTEFRVLDRRGVAHWVENRGAFHRSPSGEPTGLLGVLRDIQERKQAEEARRREHALLQARIRLSESAGTNTLDELLQFVLDEAEHLTGSEIGFLHFFDEDQETLRLQMWSTRTMRDMCTAEGKGMHYGVAEAGVWADCVRERRAIIHNDYPALADKRGLPDGHAPVVREAVVPIQVQGRIVAILGVGNKPGDYDEKDVDVISRLGHEVWEIILRRRAEEALRAHGEELQAILQSTADGILAVDSQGRAITANERFLEMWKIPRELYEKSLDHSMVEFVLEQLAEPEQFLAKVRELYASNEDDFQTLRFRDGRVFERFSRALLRDGALRGRVWSFRDVTDRYTMEEALRNHARELQIKDWALESSINAVALADMQGKMTYANPALLKMWGYESVDEILGRYAFEFWESREQALAVFRELMDTGRWAGILKARKRDGGVFPVELLASLVKDSQGQPVCLISTSLDVSERVLLEDQLRQAQKMEAVGQLAGGVAHDFNNLLQVICGYTELAASSLEETHPVQHELHEVAKAGERATQLVSQLLAFSRRQIMRPEPLSLNEVVSDLLKMLCRLIGEHIRLSFVPAESLSTIRADRGMIEQILVNLCVNARDAMPQGGDLLIETDAVEMGPEYCEAHLGSKPGSYVRLAVTDSGTGMDAETLSHIFEPFFTTKGVGQGTGLGLATVYGIVKQHNGMVQAYSELGKGTSFKVYLPALHAPGPKAGEQTKPPVRGGHETILVAEDDDLVRKLSVRILENAGYTVIAAPDGREALSLFEAHSDAVDLLLLDVMMPNLGGRDVYERARAVKPSIRALFASGYSVDAIHTDFVLHTGMELIEKPYDARELLDRIREILDRPHPAP